MTKIVFYTLMLSVLSSSFVACQKKTVKNKNVTNVYQQELESEIWITNHIISLDPKIEHYTLTKFVKRKFVGNLTSFADKTHFNSRFVSFCGADYFTTVLGKYEFFDKDKISIAVDSVTYQGEGKKPTEYRNGKELEFLISKIGDTIILTKQN
ncbi:hypothetical protein B4N84_19250 [Flavobacterium sp. IR1]|nr:hypothetical protein B4N84_19250 [Flavobacterium sp. IR1]